ncbi:4-(cytidine 5'-diphospho)-2-C-methyl-D-erythritol kinase [Levilactobacillus bambusae]|uniref:4-diphosphocytidyl-2-C-methyl-D-erythritol kinase n=1 Tax=Levilactobacillus bambusae TaxID=2024736 RepID=A0A2V1MW84_9LACO|nr:4-(cytidine 5'-diphospho)-2-C-methyl-D-erythritol kinase [Levilactobacillus bambusae]PWF99328.1 4-(cytidine 5'-diphospho)-2-C-methyl-D-erythritol kinase [Levilactobacillus bambusae]
MKVVEKAPAKINLGLDTPYHHRDGTLEWNMVMTSVDLADYVEIATEPKHPRIRVFTDSGFLPNDQRNLAYQAARVLQTRFHIHEGVTIRIQKRVPVAAGLGGGSSDAAAVLRGLNNLWQLGLSLAELAVIGLEIDSDVPYCVYGCIAHVQGRGEIITPLPKLPPMWIVLAKPKISVSTPGILRRVDYQTLEHPDIAGLLTGIRDQDLPQVFATMGNALEPITANRFPEISHIKTKMLNFGASAAQMSGTGPTLFAVCDKQSRAQRMVNSIRGFCHEVYLVRPLS